MKVMTRLVRYCTVGYALHTGWKRSHNVAYVVRGFCIPICFSDEPYVFLDVCSMFFRDILTGGFLL